MRLDYYTECYHSLNKAVHAKYSLKDNYMVEGIWVEMLRTRVMNDVEDAVASLHPPAVSQYVPQHPAGTES